MKMNKEEYFNLGWIENNYDPFKRANFLKENIKEIGLLNGHELFARMKDNTTISIGNIDGSYLLLDIIILLNELLKKGE